MMRSAQDGSNLFKPRADTRKELLASPGFPAHPETTEAALSGGPTSVDLHSDKSNWVDAMEHYGNRRPRIERLVSAWIQESDGAADPAGEPDDPLIEAAAEPRRRARTPLSDEEVGAMRTARASGVSTTTLAKRFGVHRGTVWATTR